jgi:inhibitor of KinA sporulation pathway (predicted exonuclease)
MELLDTELLVVCDLEATCWADNERVDIGTQEVIEIGCVIADLQGRVYDDFQTFVRPQRQPQLSPFCVSLTKITQQDVDAAPYFGDAMQMLDDWLKGRVQLWSSWGNYDRRMLVSQQNIDAVSSKFVELEHINLKTAWRRTTKQRRRTGLASALIFHKLDFLGTPHRAIDDARNTARILPFISRSEIEILRSQMNSQ